MRRLEFMLRNWLFTARMFGRNYLPSLSLPWLCAPHLLVQYALGTIIRFLAAISHQLPSVLATWVVSLMRLLFISMVGFTAWINRFPSEEFSSAFSLVVLCISIAYACHVSVKREDSTSLSEKITKWDNELSAIRLSIRSACDTNVAVEEKQKVVITLKSELENKRSEIKRLRKLIEEVTSRNKNLEHEIQTRKNDAIAVSRNFRGKLDEMEKIIESMKTVEDEKKSVELKFQAEKDDKEHQQQVVSVLRETVDSLDRRCKNLIDKNTILERNIREINSENKRLHQELANISIQTEEQYRNVVGQIAERLQLSLSSAKGKLNRVGDFLKDDTAFSKESYLG